MSYKFDSLITILNRLDRRETVTVASLMNDLEVSQRTAYRYIQTLQVAGFPIVYDRRKESYTFSENFSLRKPHLSVEETLAFALARNVLKGFGETLEKSFAGLEEKLSMKRPVMPAHIVLKSPDVPTPVGEWLGTLHHAIMNFQKTEITYDALGTGERTVRRVDPYYLFYQDGFWHLRAYCHLREEPRTFALDRIAALTVLDEHFIPGRITPHDELSGSFGPYVDGEPVKVVLRFDAEVKAHVLRRKWHESQKEKELPDGRLELRFTVNGTEGIRQWLSRWIPFVEVVEPVELRQAVIEDMKSNLLRYGIGS